MISKKAHDPVEGEYIWLPGCGRFCSCGLFLDDALEDLCGFFFGTEIAFYELSEFGFFESGIGIVQGCEVLDDIIDPGEVAKDSFTESGNN